MKKIKGLFAAVYKAASAPELRPAEVKIARAIGAAIIAYFSVKYGTQA